MANGTKTPIDSGLLSRVVQGVRYAITGSKPDEWFGPGQPVAPQAQDMDGAKGRQFNFPVAVNMRRGDRDGESGVSFAQMRNLADAYDLLRVVIETRKDQLEGMTWSIGLRPEIEKQQKAQQRVDQAKKHVDKVKAKNAKALVPPKLDEATGQPIPEPHQEDVPDVPDVPQEDPRFKELRDFFAFPDQEHGWNTWLRALIEDMLVLDAPTVYPRMTLGGDLYALELVDGSTVKRIIDSTGRTPLPPDPAYQQILQGLPAVDYTRDELIYRPRNVRTHKVYGYGPVEQIIMTVNIAMRRQIHQLQYYTEGNVPEAMIGVPEEWNPDQIRQFQEYWDAMLEGNTGERRHAKFVPGKMSMQLVRPEGLKDEMDEWLARIVCFAFSLSPQALVKQMNRATASTAQDMAMSEGLLPMMNWVKELMDYIIWKYFGYADIEFKWDKGQESSPLDQMTVLTGYVAGKVMTDDEARDKLGMPALTPEQRSALTPPAPPVQPFGGGFGPHPGGNQPPGAKTPPNGPAVGGTDKPVGKLQGALATKSLKPLSRARNSVKACTSDINALVGPALAAAGKRIAKSLADQATKMDKAISVDDKTMRLLTELTFEELQEIAPDLAELLEDMTGEGGAAALAQVLSDVTPDQLEQVHDRAVDYAQERSASLVTDLEDATRTMLQSDLAQGLTEGMSNDDLADLLADNYAFSDERADCIARTETAAADVEGNLEGYRASGVVDQKEWITAQGDFCDDCQGLNGQIVPLDDDFTDDGGNGPPLHPNCRCDILPVLAEGE